MDYIRISSFIFCLIIDFINLSYFTRSKFCNKILKYFYSWFEGTLEVFREINSAYYKCNVSPFIEESDTDETDNEGDEGDEDSDGEYNEDSDGEKGEYNEDSDVDTDDTGNDGDDEKDEQNKKTN